MSRTHNSSMDATAGGRTTANAVNATAGTDTTETAPEEDGLSKALGLIGTLGAVFSYLLVYIFRLGEAMRYRFDPSLITVSINDFLTVLIPIAACLAYLFAISLVIRDLDQSAQRERRRAQRRSPTPQPTEGPLHAAVLPILAYALPHALVWTALSAACPAACVPAAALLGVAQCATVFRRMGPASSARAASTPATSAHTTHATSATPTPPASHPKELRLSPTRGELLFASVSLCMLPLWLTLAIGLVQSSTWLCLVAAALVSLGLLAALMRLGLHVSPLAWSCEVVRRGGRGLSDRPTKATPVAAGLLAAVLALFLLAGYTNQLDFTGSRSLVLADTQTGTDYAVLALFDGNRAVVRTATPTPDADSYAVDLSEPYHVVYLTDGYQVLQARSVQVDD